MKYQIALYLAGSLLNYALVEGWLTGAIDRALWRHSRRYRRLQIRRSLVGWRLDYHDRGSRIHIIGERKKIENGAKNET
jgi:hypothetical protein